MIKKQILFSIIILGTIINNGLATDRVFNQGWNNGINRTYLSLAIISPIETDLDDIKIINKFKSDIFIRLKTIGFNKKHQKGLSQNISLQHITSNNAILCGPNIILLNSTDLNDCEKIRNDYEEVENEVYLRKKNTTK